MSVVSSVTGYRSTLWEDILWHLGLPTSQEKMKAMKRAIPGKIGELKRDIEELTFRQKSLNRQLHVYAKSLKDKKDMRFDRDTIRSFTTQIAQISKQISVLNKAVNAYISIETRLLTTQLDHTSINVLRELAVITASQFGNPDAIIKLEQRLEKAKMANEMIGDTVMGEFSSASDLDTEAADLEENIIGEYFYPKPPSAIPDPIIKKAISRSRIAVKANDSTDKKGPDKPPDKPPPPTPDAFIEKETVAKVQPAPVKLAAEEITPITANLMEFFDSDAPPPSDPAPETVEVQEEATKPVDNDEKVESIIDMDWINHSGTQAEEGRVEPSV